MRSLEDDNLSGPWTTDGRGVEQMDGGGGVCENPQTRGMIVEYSRTRQVLERERERESRVVVE